MTYPNEPIAIIGSGCRFPGNANNPSALWTLLKSPTDCLSEIPKERFNWQGYHYNSQNGPHHGAIKTKYTHFLSPTTDITRFDAPFFSIKPADAEAMDPQQRLLLETVYEGLEDAGLTIESLRGSDTAVYVGLMNCDYGDLLQDDVDCIPAYAGTGVSRSIHSNRISWFFDWRGPSMTIDTACSSSMMAVHLAVRSLRSGEAKVAVACGANVLNSPQNYIVLSQLGMISSDGRGRMWDASANGYSRGEGVASIILKPLSAAIADGDPIDCIIRETGVNHDGHTRRITVPSSEAQADLIRKTYARAGLDISKREGRPQYFEAHGTGTMVGDPREAEAVNTAFFEGEELNPSDEDVIQIGSIKTVIGHTEATAGLAGILKAALAVKHGHIPPNMLFESLNPAVAPYARYLCVPTELKPWPVLPKGVPRRASVNGFGFGGSNGHAILESFHDGGETSLPIQSDKTTSVVSTPFVFSAQSERSLITMLQNFTAYLESDTGEVDLRSIAYTLQHRKSIFSLRTAITALDRDDLLSKLQRVLSSSSGSPVGVKPTIQHDTAGILGIFTGQGAQWAGMIQSLLKASPRAREIIRSLDQSLATVPREQDRPSWRIEDELMKSQEASRIHEAPISQPLCTAVQILLVDMLRSAGVQLHAVVGHSSGEIAAAYAAGFITAADAIRIAYYRGFCARFAGGRNGHKGAMIATGLSPAEARELCDSPQFHGRLDVAAYNSSANVVLSGDVDAIHEANSTLIEKKRYARLLKVDTAYHSHHMLPCAEPYLEALRSCAIRPAEGSSTIWLSSVVPGQTMSLANSGQLSSEYWVTNMTSPVFFADALATTVINSALGPFDLGVEIGPHPALHSSVLQTIQEAGQKNAKFVYTGVLSRGQNDLAAFAEALGKIWAHWPQITNAINFARYDQTFIPNATPVSFVRDLPTYPWDHSKSYWFESRWERARRNRTGPVHSLLGVPYGDATDTELKWRNFLVPKEIPWLLDHRIQGRMVFPAAGYAVMACEAALLRAKADGVEGEVRLAEVLNVTIHRAISFDDERTAVEVVLTLSDIRTQTRTRMQAVKEKAMIANWAVHSPVNNETDKLSLVCSGSVSLQLGSASPRTLPGRADSVEDLPNMVPVDVDEFYNALSEVGYGYTGPFRRISRLHRKLRYSVGSFLPPPPLQETLMHPALLDTAFQAFAAAESYPGDGGLRGLQVPTTIGAIRINPYHCQCQYETMFLEAILPRVGSSASKPDTGGDVNVYSSAGDAFFQIESVNTVPLTKPTSADDRNIFSEEIWGPADPDAESNLFAMEEECATDDDVERAYACERAVHFYMKMLFADVQALDLDARSAALRNQQLLDCAGDLVSEVANSKQRYYELDWATDTQENILQIYERYLDCVDLALIKAVGEDYLDIVGHELDCLKHSKKEDMLSTWYADGFGFKVANTCAARLIKQISHRHPHMDICEIGNAGTGTGALTTIILNHLGAAYRSYTYANTSSSHNTAKAQGGKSAIRNRTIFMSLDLENDPQSQGYREHSYDLVTVSNVTYTSKNLSQSLRHIRSLLRPGGFLLLVEPTGTGQQPARVKFLMAGLLHNGTRMSPAQWHNLLQSTGYSGIETIATPSPGTEASLVCPLSVFVTQAVDHRISILRQPLFARVDAEVATHLQDLLIVGGGTLETARICTDIQVMLLQRFRTIRVIETLEEVNRLVNIPTTILVLVELEDSIFKRMSTNLLQAVKSLWNNGHSVLWVLRDARDAEPYRNMTIGLGRSVRNEARDLRLQFLDIEDGSAVEGRCLAEMILRLRATQLWEQEGTLDQILWSTEPEYRLTKDKRLLIPRLYEQKDQNNRYNSRQRQIMYQASPAIEKVSVAYQRVSGALRLVSEFPALPTENGHLVSIRVLCSLVSALKLADGQSLFPLLGRRTDTNEVVFALSPSNTSVVVVSPQYIVLLDGVVASDAANPQALLLRLVWELVADFILANANPGVILARGVQTEFLDVLCRRADLREMSAISIMVDDCDGQQLKETQSITIHPRGLKSELKAKLPPDISVFLDLSSSDPEKDDLHNSLTSVLPKSCQAHNATTLFSPTSSSFSSSKSSYLQYTSLRELLTVVLSSNTHPMLSDYADRLTLPLREVPQLTNDDREPLTMIDWTSETTVPIDVTPVDKDLCFAPDKTYLLVGLTGDLGQSLCEWFIEHGAKQLVLTSRNPNAQISDKWYDSITAGGVTIKVYTMDVSDKESVQTVYDKIQRIPTLPPIAGVVNAAMVLHDKTFPNMTLDDLVSVMKPKVDGSQNLHEVFGPEHPLDFFILFSSISYVIGNAGQANYAAANAFMASLVANRRKRGLAGSVMHIGPIIGAGHITRSGSRFLNPRALSASGAYPLSVSDFHQLFAEAVLASPSDSGRKPDIVAGIRKISIGSNVNEQNWDRVLWRGDPRFSHFCTIEEEGSKCAGDIKHLMLSVKMQLADTTSEENAKNIIQECFTSRLATLLRLDTDRIDIHVPLNELGMDSLVAVEVRSWFTKQLGVDVSILRILSGASVVDLVEDALEGIGLEMLPKLNTVKQEVEEETAVYCLRYRV